MNKITLSECKGSSMKLPPEQEAIRSKCYHPLKTFVEFPEVDIETSIPARFEKIASLYPDSIALRTADETITYDELNREANHIAECILTSLGSAEEPLPILLGHSAQGIAAILGILKSGKAYMSLNPIDPPRRIAAQMLDLKAPLLLTNDRYFSLAEMTAGKTSLLNLDKIGRGPFARNHDVYLTPDRLAAIFYTSGSTGEPKGVLHEHRNLLYNARTYSRELGIALDDRFTLFHSYGWYASTRNLFGALLNGASVYPYDASAEKVPELGDWLRMHEITIYHSVSTLFRQLLETRRSEKGWPKLRVLQLANDLVTPKDVELYRKYLSPNCIFANRLGTTEFGTFLTYFMDKDMPLTGDKVPVGHASENAEVFLVDENLRRIAGDDIGEIAIKSRFLSPGYWNNPSLTQQIFRLDPTDGGRIYLTGDLGRMLSNGQCEYMGRKSSSVKIRGFRVEIPEVEGALSVVEGVTQCAVVVQKNKTAENLLVAYVTWEINRKHRPSVNELRELLREKLPAYMIPSRFVFLERLPLTQAGKIDKQALSDLGAGRPEIDTPFVAPKTSVEKELQRIWSEIFSIDEIGVHDNFFDLGGHSLTASQVISRVLRRFQLELPVKLLFDSPTVAEMAGVIAAHQARLATQVELERMLNEVETMSDEETQRCVEKMNATIDNK